MELKNLILVLHYFNKYRSNGQTNNESEMTNPSSWTPFKIKKSIRLIAQAHPIKYYYNGKNLVKSLIF